MSKTSTHTDDKKLQREIDFHNNRYASDSENRTATSKYYRLKKTLDEHFLKEIKSRSLNGCILEIGCGPNINTPHWIDSAKESWAIDISDVAIEQGRHRLRNTPNKAHLEIMNAEAMTFADNYFDVVCGKGIIHHLNVEKSYREVSRVLKPDGIAIFIEPLGHNPIINAYRNRTPQMRSDDEHPLLQSDLKLAGTYFQNTDFTYRHISRIAAAYLPDGFLFEAASGVLGAMDSIITTVLPFTKKYCWMVLMKLEHPQS